MKKILTACCLLGCIGSAWLSAQESIEPDTEEVFIETMDVNLVNVDVFVTDKKGNPIKGLTRDDFEIYEDGRLVLVSNFSVLEEGFQKKVEKDEEEREDVTAVESPTDVPSATLLPEEEDRLHLIIYIDNFNVEPLHRNRAFRQLRGFIRKSLRPGDRIMLVSYERSLKERVPFTTDATLVNNELLALERTTGYGTSTESDRREVRQEIQRAENYSDALTRVRLFAENRLTDIHFTIDALKGFLEILGGLPGHKALVHLSDGLPMVVAEDLFYTLQDEFSDGSAVMESRTYDVSRRWLQLSRQANSNDVVFYGIDAGGLRTMGASAQERSYRGQHSIVSDTVHVQNVQSTLRLIATETGGQVIANTNDISEGLDRIISDFRTRYSLGYMPIHSGLGRYHKIEVKVKGAKKNKWKARHRLGYRDKSIALRMEDNTKAALLFGSGKNKLKVSLKFERPIQQQEGRHWVTPVSVRIPLNQLVLVRQGDLYHARLRVAFMAADEGGGKSEVQQSTFAFTVKAEEWEEAKTKFYSYEIPLLMKKGEHQVAVGLRDEVSGEESFVRGRVRVGGGAR